MAYEVTATRKRPRSFDHMVGQEFVVASLSNSIKTGRIAHAYLFSGPRGVGKTSAARILARALNCPDGPTADSCTDYPGSEEISRGTSLDVIEIDGASNTSVNDIRTIKDEVLFPPQSSRYKIYIIDEVHMLSNSAFNALLKTIEEPPPYIIFIFATTEIHKVPATIRSRCQQFNFRLIPQEDIIRLLAEAARELGVEAETEALSWIAKEATGSLRDAYTLFDQVVSFSGQVITFEKIREKLGVLGLDRLNEIAELLVSGNSAGALELFDSMMAGGISLEQFVEDLAEYFRSLLLLKNGIRRENLLGYNPAGFSGVVTEALRVEQLERLIEMLLQVYRNIRYTMNPRFDVEIWLSKAASISRYLPMGEIVAKLEGLSNGAAAQATEVPKNTTPPPSSATVPTPTVPNAPAVETRPAKDPAGSKAAIERFRSMAGSTEAPVSQPKPAPQSIPRPVAPPVAEPAPTEPAPAKPAAEPAPAEPAPAKPAAEATPPKPPTPESEQSARITENPNEIGENDIAQVLNQLRKSNITLATSLEKAVSWVLKGSQLVISFTHEMPAKMVGEQKKAVQPAVDTVLMPGLAIEIALVKGQSDEEVLLDPQVQLVQSVFKGSVVE